jgi:hypothetical protein
MMTFQNPICLGMRFFGIWLMGNHMFMSIFHSPELRKWLTGGKKPNACKTILFYEV